ncbi:signal transduction histidine kinase [Marinobacter daqiaonensis]|uniref:histidine kinase n=1 Tax=Marinobacter daqiaonensis TaxID=650891 RepID=A0A1I6GES8_9GAMM|nr:HAMP domain-containing sensor histidine kinase [Marinobacter daqiaonensis]SFR40686.1 signal transduction histidine kinase [Marinobacter daqiaonensis]
MSRDNEKSTSQIQDLPVPDFSMVIASAVHDMKNSLGMLLSTLEDLRQEQQSQLGDNPRMNTLQYEAERVHSDLVQLLGIYRLGEHKLSAHSDEHYVADFLSEQVARHEPLLKGYGIEYSIETSAETTGYFDEELVAGIIASTLNNAIRYTSTRIALKAREEDGWLVISIEDDGAGYPAHMKNAGDALIKAPDFRTGSTSLGLYFATAIARLHENCGRHGDIRIRNGGSLGGGVFEIWLP